MARVAGVNIPDNKTVKYSLTYIYGIGESLSVKILAQANVDGAKRVFELTDEELNRVREVVEKSYKVEGEVRQFNQESIKRLKEINCHRGARHAKKLPARGQRTKTNSRTVRGNVRRTASSGKKKGENKT